MVSGCKWMGCCLLSFLTMQGIQAQFYTGNDVDGARWSLLRFCQKIRNGFLQETEVSLSGLPANISCPRNGPSMAVMNGQSWIMGIPAVVWKELA